jgi:hypothetical protein
VNRELQSKLDASRDYKMEKRDWFSSDWLVSVNRGCEWGTPVQAGRVTGLQDGEAGLALLKLAGEWEGEGEGRKGSL